MANNVIGSLLVNLGLETARLNSDTEKAARHFNSFDKKASRALNSVKRQASGLGSALTSLTGITGTLSVVGLGALAKSSIDSADKIGKLSDRIGASTEALSQYQHVAELSGVRFETLTMGWQRMTRRVAEAAQGTGEARGALEELNLSAQDLSRLRPEQQFEAIANAISGVGSQSDKVRLAMKLFDSEGVSLLQTMTGGAAGIKAMRQEADDLGLTLTHAATRSAANANDALTRLNSSSKALGLTLAEQLGPTLADVANWLSANIPLALRTAGIYFDQFRIGALTIYADLAEKFSDKDNPIIKSVRATINHLTGELIDAQNQIQNFNSNRYNTSFGGDSGGSDDETNQKAIDALTARLMTEEEKIAESYFNRQEIADAALEQGLINNQEWGDLSTRIHQDRESRLTAITKQEGDKRAKLEQDVQNRIAGMRQSVASLTVGLMRTLGKDSKKWAIAAIAVEKGLSIALAIQNTAVAVTKALSLGPVGYAMIPGIKAMGAVQVGLIAATGIAQAANVSSGGGGISASGAPTPVEPINNPANNTPAGVDPSNEIRIRIVGSGDEFTEMVAKSIEQAEANDRITIIRA